VATQIAVRLPDGLVRDLDDLVARGVYESRAAVVRAGIEAVAERERRAAVDEAIVRGYRRVPTTPAEEATALAALRESIAEEPW
jgi:Arc/MetJ-type ribon-helix-helix transcriptional regulator